MSTVTITDRDDLRPGDDTVFEHGEGEGVARTTGKLTAWRTDGLAVGGFVVRYDRRPGASSEWNEAFRFVSATREVPDLPTTPGALIDATVRLGNAETYDDLLLARAKSSTNCWRWLVLAGPNIVLGAGIAEAEIVSWQPHAPADSTPTEPTPETQRRYKVGDLDPTPDEGPFCSESDGPGGHWCTWPEGDAHSQHVCGNGVTIDAVWDA